MSHIIALNGRSGSGKDTLAQLLKPHGYKRYAFGDQLREKVVSIYGPPASTDERSKNCYPHVTPPLSMKEAMCKVGESAILENPQQFVQGLTQKVKQHFNWDKEPVVITDMRRPVEMLGLAELGFPIYFIHVERPDTSPMPFDDLLPTDGQRLGLYQQYGVMPADYPELPRFHGKIVNYEKPERMLEQLAKIFTLAIPHRQ